MEHELPQRPQPPPIGAADAHRSTRAVELPVIGLRKLEVTGTGVHIPPTSRGARNALAAGALAVVVGAGGRLGDDA